MTLALSQEQAVGATDLLRALVAEEVARAIERALGTPAVEGQVSLPRAAQITGVTTRTIRRWEELGLITFKRINRRPYVVLSELETLGAQGKR
jgi:hypothetical protein